MYEEWRAVAGNANYMVSDQGRVKRISCIVRVGGPRACMRPLPERQLKQTVVAPGYLQVNIPRIGKVRVHQLVARAFLGPDPFPRAHVNHLDNDKMNNRLSNLEWTTPSENAFHSFRTTDRVGSCADKFGADNPTSIAVVATCMKTGKEIRYAAAADAVRERGFQSSGISVACSGKRPSYKGYYWRYERGYGRGESP